jgi:hypothetical protein
MNDKTLLSSIDSLWNHLKENILEISRKHVPSKLSSAKYSHPWMTTTLRRAERRKQRAHKKMNKTGKKRDKDRYKRIQAEVNFAIKRAGKNYLEEIVSEDFVNKPKKFWSFIKSKGQESCGIPPLIDEYGYLRSEAKNKAEILNNQFKSVFTVEDTSNFPDKGASPYTEMRNIKVDKNGIQKLLMDLNPNKATGPDQIPAYILKTGAEELAQILTILFQLSLDQGQVPNEWREAWVTPIFKKGDKHQPSNYRPISLTSIVCKVLEHVVHSNVMRHFDRNKILNDAQHGFRKARSCETQLIITVHDIAASLASGSQVDAILLDFSKAFDKVPHERLLYKLQYYGVVGNSLNWIRAFLTNRVQQVTLEGTHSTSAAVSSGVPQGTVLGPLLFLAYINDLPDDVKHSKTRLFADDSLLHREIKSKRDQTLLQQDLDALASWEESWQMSFNASKCNTIHIAQGKRKEAAPFGYKLHGQILESVNSSKYLGVTINSKLNWSEHVENVSANGKKKVGFLRRNFKDCTAKAKAATYTTIVRPALDYAAPVWDPHLEKDKTMLEKVQRQAARYVFNNYTDRTPGIVTSMLQKLHWESLERRREIQRLIMLYRIKNLLVDIPKDDYLKPSDPRTRGDKILQQHAKHPAIANSFFPRTTSNWNHLPISTTQAPSLDVFHARLAHNPMWSSMGGP